MNNIDTLSTKNSILVPGTASVENTLLNSNLSKRFSVKPLNAEFSCQDSEKCNRTKLSMHDKCVKFAKVAAIIVVVACGILLTVKTSNNKTESPLVDIKNIVIKDSNPRTLRSSFLLALPGTSADKLEVDAAAKLSFAATFHNTTEAPLVDIQNIVIKDSNPRVIKSYYPLALPGVRAPEVDRTNENAQNTNANKNSNFKKWIVRHPKTVIYTIFVAYMMALFGLFKYYSKQIPKQHAGIH